MSNYKLTENETRAISAILAALPQELTGTEKQIAYARDIIRRSAEWAGEATFGSAARKATDIDAYCATLSKLVSTCPRLQVTEAKRWIEASAANYGKHVDIRDVANGKAKL